VLCIFPLVRVGCKCECVCVLNAHVWGNGEKGVHASVHMVVDLSRVKISTPRA